MIQPNVGSKGEGDSGWTGENPADGYGLQAQSQQSFYAPPPPQQQQSVYPSGDPGTHEPQTQGYYGQAAPRYSEISSRPPGYPGSGYGGGGLPQ